MTKNVLDYLYTSKEKFPLKTAVADNVSSMTYTELVDNATTIAVALLKYTGARSSNDRQFLCAFRASTSGRENSQHT